MSLASPAYCGVIDHRSPEVSGSSKVQLADWT